MPTEQLFYVFSIAHCFGKPFRDPDGCFCKVAREKVKDPDDDGDEDGEDDEVIVVAAESHPVVATSSEIHESATEYLGWRTSFRSSEPEKPNMVKILKKLERKNAHFRHLALVDAERHAPPQDEALANAAKVACQMRKAAESQEFALLRRAS